VAPKPGFGKHHFRPEDFRVKRFILAIIALGVVGAVGFLVVTKPRTTDPAELDGLAGDPVKGEMVFWAGGCAACHAEAGTTGDARLVLSGGQRFVTPFGTFVAPNISPDPAEGIGSWTLLDLDNAMRHGTSPEGEHYYPAFPYTSFANATHQDIADLKAFLDTLPASDRPNEPHELPFPLNQRIVLGGWKFLNPGPGWVVNGDLDDEEQRGRYLVEALGHCGECHTPRNRLGIREDRRWLAGGPSPDNKGKVPNITPGVLDWPEDKIAAYLKTGFTPEFDVVGGAMADVVTNLSHLPDSDRAAIAAYLKQVPPVQ
jgi:mono/diheme cytochrome c family protein